MANIGSLVVDLQANSAAFLQEMQKARQASEQTARGIQAGLDRMSAAMRSAETYVRGFVEARLRRGLQSWRHPRLKITMSRLVGSTSTGSTSTRRNATVSTRCRESWTASQEMLARSESCALSSSQILYALQSTSNQRPAHNGLAAPRVGLSMYA